MIKICIGCGSFAINEHCDGREKGKDLDLCDVCYWRIRSDEKYKDYIEEKRNGK